MSEPEYLPTRTLSPTLMSIGDALAVVVHLARADRDHLGLLRLFLGGVGDDDASADLFLLVDPLDQDTVLERTNFH